jgi:uncharacterized protein YceH (UPF0502 family)
MPDLAPALAAQHPTPAQLELAKLEREVAALQEEVAELRRRLAEKEREG